MTSNNHFSGGDAYFEKPKVFGNQLELENGEELIMRGSDNLDMFLHFMAVRKPS